MGWGVMALGERTINNFYYLCRSLSEKFQNDFKGGASMGSMFTGEE